MTDGLSTGPGVRRFWQLVGQGEEPDLSELGRAFPEEAGALARAAVQAARQREARTRERLWGTLHRVLQEQHEAITLGEVLRQRRLALGLTERALAQQLAEEGLRVAPLAIQRLESGALSPLAVKPPGNWRAFARTLKFDSTHLMSLLELSAQRPRETQHFTRMARGATDEDRAQFLTDTREGSDTDAQHYLDEVRRALGLPPRTPA